MNGTMAAAGVATHAHRNLSGQRRTPARNVHPWESQAVTTWHHVQGGLSGSTNEQKSAARANRNAYRALTGETEQNDANVAAVLASVLA